MDCNLSLYFIEHISTRRWKATIYFHTKLSTVGFELAGAVRGRCCLRGGNPKRVLGITSWSSLNPGPLRHHRLAQQHLIAFHRCTLPVYCVLNYAASLDRLYDHRLLRCPNLFNRAFCSRRDTTPKCKSCAYNVCHFEENLKIF